MSSEFVKDGEVCSQPELRQREAEEMNDFIYARIAEKARGIHRQWSWHDGKGHIHRPTEKENTRQVMLGCLGLLAITLLLVCFVLFLLR